jgi:hypothetical protein
MYCKRCSTRQPDGLVFCTNCGKPMGALITYPDEAVVSQAVPSARATPAGGTNGWIFIVAGLLIAFFGIAVAATVIIYGLSARTGDTTRSPDAQNTAKSSAENTAPNLDPKHSNVSSVTAASNLTASNRTDSLIRV